MILTFADNNWMYNNSGKYINNSFPFNHQSVLQDSICRYNSNKNKQ